MVGAGSFDRRSMMSVGLGGAALVAMAGAAGGEASMSSEAPIPVKPGHDGLIFASFIAGAKGQWRIERVSPVIGDPLAPAPRLAVIEQATVEPSREDSWMLRGTTSNVRYATEAELHELKPKQAGLGRPEATLAALIPIRKSAAWWDMAQDQRRAVFEEQSRHIDIGLNFLPGVARRLYHSRDLGGEFDFLTWFEYAPEHREEFETLVGQLRATPEWAFVDREVDIRLSRG